MLGGFAYFVLTQFGCTEFPVAYDYFACNDELSKLGSKHEGQRQCEQQSPEKVFNETETGCSHGGVRIWVFRSRCLWMQKTSPGVLLPHAEVVEPTRGLHGLLGKAGGELLSTVSVSDDDSFACYGPFVAMLISVVTEGVY